MQILPGHLLNKLRKCHPLSPRDWRELTTCIQKRYQPFDYQCVICEACGVFVCNLHVYTTIDWKILSLFMSKFDHLIMKLFALLVAIVNSPWGTLCLFCPFISETGIVEVTTQWLLMVIFEFTLLYLEQWLQALAIKGETTVRTLSLELRSEFRSVCKFHFVLDFCMVVAWLICYSLILPVNEKRKNFGRYYWFSDVQSGW